MIVNRRICAVVAASIALSGCASLINPHVRAQALDRTLTGADAKLAASLYGDLPQAIDDASAQESAYLEAAADHSRFRSATILALLPLTAITLYKGITGTSNSHNLAALTLGAGSMYFGGSFFYSDTRQRVYMEGARAIECSITAIRPYLVTTEDYQRFAKGKNALGNAIPPVNRAIANLRGVEAAGETDPQWHKRITAEIRSAQRLISRASRVSSESERYDQNLKKAGFDLLHKVRAITIKVGEEVIKTEPNWQSLAALRSGISAAAGQFGQGGATAGGSSDAALPASKTPLEGGQQSKGKKSEVIARQAEARAKAEEEKRRRKAEIERALSNLAIASGELAAAINQQSVLLNGFSDVKKSTEEALKSCDPAEVKSNFALSPDAAEITVVPGTPFFIVVLNPAGAIDALPGGAAASRLEVTVKGQQVQVKAKDASDSGVSGNDAVLEIFDTAGNKKSVHVVIGQAVAQPEPPAPKNEVPPQTPPKKDPKVLCAQKALNADAGSTVVVEDGVMGPKTEAALKGFAVKKGITIKEGESPLSADVLKDLKCQ